MSDYTPTTNEVMVQYTRGWVTKRAAISKADGEAATDEFLRWLAAHDAEVAAKALRDAADEYRSGQLTGMFLGRDDYAKEWLRARAARLSPGGEG